MSKPKKKQQQPLTTPSWTRGKYFTVTDPKHAELKLSTVFQAEAQDYTKKFYNKHGVICQIDEHTYVPVDHPRKKR